MYCDYECSVALSCGALGGLQCVSLVFPNHTHLPLGAYCAFDSFFDYIKAPRYL